MSVGEQRTLKVALQVQVLRSRHGQDEHAEHELHHGQVNDESGGSGAQALGHRQSDNRQQVT